MTVDKNKITIVLEEDEIEQFCNVIQFALDYDAQESARGNSCMYDDEHELAEKLVKATMQTY